jgi:hypothetical protein
MRVYVTAGSSSNSRSAPEGARSTRYSNHAHETPNHAHLVCDSAPSRLPARLKWADEHPPVEFGSALLAQFGSRVMLTDARHAHAAKKQ